MDAKPTWTWKQVQPTNYRLPPTISVNLVDGPTVSTTSLSWSVFCKALQLIEEMPPAHFSLRVQNYGIHNIASRVLSHAETLLLANGLSFIPTPPAASNGQLMTDFDRFRRSIRLRHMFKGHTAPGDKLYRPNPSFQPKPAPLLVEQELLEKKRLLARELTRNPVRRIRCNLPRSQRQALRTLRDDTSIVIRNADKNLGPTIMDESWVRSESLRQLSDRETYRKIGKVNVRSIVNQLHSLVDKFFPSLDFDHPDYHDRRKLRRFLLCPPDEEDDLSYRIPVFYIIPKLHKTPVVGRPIVSNINWVTTNVSILLDHYLRQFINTSTVPSYLQDSLDLVRVLETSSFPKDCLLVTLDIASLYPSIPLKDGLQALRAFVSHHTPLDPEIMALAHWVLYSNYISFADLFFKQIKGVAMGTPFAVVFAVIFVAAVEARFLNLAGVALFKRFIDDIFMVWTKSRAELIEFIRALNQAHPALKFTFEISSSSIAFMDLHIHKGDRFNRTGRLDLSTYQKTLNQYAYITFRSHHPPSQKEAFVKGELTRYVRSTSSHSQFTILRELFFWRLQRRGYPTRWLEKVFAKVMYAHRSSMLAPKTDRNKARALNLVFKTVYSPRHRSLRFRDLLTLTPGLVPQLQSRKATLCLRKGKNLGSFLTRSRHPLTAT